MLLPLLTLEEVYAELAETDRDLDDMHVRRIVDVERWLELRDLRRVRREKLLLQIAEMEDAT
jgi:hypothetical protein